MPDGEGQGDGGRSHSLETGAGMVCMHSFLDEGRNEKEKEAWSSFRS